MKIEIIGRKPKIELFIKKSKKSKSFTMFDKSNKFTESKIYFNKLQSKIPSTLLSRWVNENLQDDLLKLRDRCYSVQKVKEGKYGRWYFTNHVNAIYGLHKIKIGQDRIIKIDDSIGMQQVLYILNKLGYGVVVDYDFECQIVSKITISKLI